MKRRIGKIRLFKKYKRKRKQWHFNWVKIGMFLVKIEIKILYIYIHSNIENPKLLLFSVIESHENYVLNILHVIFY